MALQFRLWKIPSDEELEFLNEHLAPLRFERTLDGELSLSPPTGFATGEQNAELNRQLGNWNIAHGIEKALLPGATDDLVLDPFAIFDAGA